MNRIEDAGHVIGSYAITFVAIALYVLALRSRARRSATRIPEEDRPWT